MIFDSMNRFASYAKLSPEVWKKLATFIAGCTPETPAGRYEKIGRAHV